MRGAPAHHGVWFSGEVARLSSWTIFRGGRPLIAGTGNWAISIKANSESYFTKQTENAVIVMEEQCNGIVVHIIGGVMLNIRNKFIQIEDGSHKAGRSSRSETRTHRIRLSRNPRPQLLFI